MASFEDLAFDWSSLCQECPECWTPSAIILCIATGTNGIVLNRVWKLPKPRYNAMTGQVCGSNFETYASYERFVQANARVKDLVVLHAGPCSRTCQMYKPVCGSNGVTYHNQCHLTYAKRKVRQLTQTGIGLCQPRRENLPTDKDDIAMDYYDDTLRSYPDYDNIRYVHLRNTS